MADKNTELIRLQTHPSDTHPSVTKSETNMLLAPTSVYERLRHLPDNIYDLSPESKLVKFMKAVLGDAGAGQLRKKLLIHRMQSTLQGTHFYDLDRFYGPLFGIKRNVSEQLDFNPYIETATREQWGEAHAKDASFRSRIEQFARALTYGATPTGMELLAEALLSVDVDVYESYVQADASFQSYEELEEQYGVNLLSDNETSIEDDATGWTAASGVTALTRSDAWAFPDGFTEGGGEHSLRVETDGSGDAEIEIDSPPEVTPGEEYTFALVGAYFGHLDSLGSPGDLTEVHLEIDWLNSGAALISTDSGDPVLVGDVGEQVFVTAEAPPTAAEAVLRIVITNPDSGEFFFFDRLEWSVLNYGDMEGVSYADLEGLNLARLSGDERRVFTIRPKRPITLSESYDLANVLYRLKPADARFIIDYRGVNLYQERTINAAYADSEYWEVIPKVSSASLAINPYQALSNAEPVEQPRPPFSSYQGEAWSYITDLAGVSAYTKASAGDDPVTMPVTEVVYTDGTSGKFSAEQAMLPSRMVQAGRLVSDAILVTYPYENRRDTRVFTAIENDAEAVSRLYADGIPLDDFNRVLKTLPDVDPFQQNPQHRYWVTPTRSKNDTAEEVLEIRLARPSLVNYLSFETAKYPHRLIVEVLEVGAGSGAESSSWTKVLDWEYNESFPRILFPGQESTLRAGHPHHSHPNHWERLRYLFDDPAQVRRVRIRLRRTDGIAPKGRRGADAPDLPYSLAIRAFDVGYRVRSRKDFDFIDGDEIGTTNDMFGSQVRFDISEAKADLVLDNELTAWKSEPQPVNYAVVNLYLDTRNGDDGTVIDRFYMDPTHDGPHLTIYYSMDIGDPDPANPEEFFENLEWTPIPRDFVVQKGYLHIPPTRARFFKFEFTNLTAEPYENFLPIDRQVKLFPRHIVEDINPGHGHAQEALLPGMNAAIGVADTVSYRDALVALRQTTRTPDGQYLPTESLYVTDLHAQQSMREQSWVFGFTPWHQDQKAPRFQTKGKHVYEEIEVRHSHKVAFFVGLRTLKAYRANWEANDDPTVYFDTYDDLRNLTTPMTWTFDPGAMKSGSSLPVQATSRTFLSRSNIKAVQFATEQSNPIQLVPDSEFRNPALRSYDWSNPDRYLRVGDAQLTYLPTEYAVVVTRYVVPPPRPLDRTGGLVQTIHQPVFSWRPFEVADEQAAAATEGGLKSPLLSLSDDGRAYAAVRFTMLTDQSSPLLLQVINPDDDDDIIAQKEISARRGQTVEDWIGFDIPAPNMNIRFQLIQEGKSNDSWKISSMALFDEGIVWEFSVNGGGDWYKAREIRNNDNGMLTFPSPGNQLRYRVTAYRPNMWVSAIKIRPHYLGVGNARMNGTHRGPNVSFYDQDVPIHEDPMFTAWRRPVPYYWFAASRRFPLLAVEGDFTSEFSSLFARPVAIGVDAPHVTVDYDHIHVRHTQERLDFLGPNVVVERELDLAREAATNVGEPDVQITWQKVYGVEDGLIHPPVDPIFSEQGMDEEEGDSGSPGSPGDSE